MNKVLAGYVLLTYLSSSIWASQTDPHLPETETLSWIERVMEQSPPKWPLTWQGKYIETIQQVIAEQEPPCSEKRLTAIREGFSIVWPLLIKKPCTEERFEVFLAEIRWYVQQLCQNADLSASKIQSIQADFTELYNYVEKQIQLEFPSLSPACLHLSRQEIDIESLKRIEAPLLPIYAIDYSPQQIEEIKADLSVRQGQRKLMWNQLACDRYNESFLSEIEDPNRHPHKLFVRKCFKSVLTTMWIHGPKVPDYCQAAIKKQKQTEISKRALVKQNRDLLFERSFTGVDQVERLTFMYMSLLETPASSIPLTDQAQLYDFTAAWNVSDPLHPRKLYGMVISHPKIATRIITYWADVINLSTNEHSLTYSDLIMDQNSIHLWLPHQDQIQYPINQFLCSFQAPLQNQLPEVLKSTLSAISMMRSPTSVLPSWDMQNFFQHSQSVSSCLYQSNQTYLNKMARDPNSFQPPLARRFEKVIKKDNTTQWSLWNIPENKSIATIEIRPQPSQPIEGLMFSPTTLGQCPWVPDAYHTYWALISQMNIALKQPDNESKLRIICLQGLDSISDPTRSPVDIEQARVCTDLALTISDIPLVSQCIHTEMGLIRGTSTHRILDLIEELGHFSQQAQSHLTTETHRKLLQELIQVYLQNDIQQDHKLLSYMVKYAISMEWFQLAQGLLDTVQETTLSQNRELYQLAELIKTHQGSLEVIQSDPNDDHALTRLVDETLKNQFPPSGTISLVNIKELLDKNFPATDPNMPFNSHNVANQICSLIERLAGPGPYDGDLSQLERSVQYLNPIYHLDNPALPNIYATLFALSFHDLSTQDNHLQLIGQIKHVSQETQKLLWKQIEHYKLTELITSEEIQSIFETFETRSEFYVHQPLWPMYKFPLTENEYTRYLCRMKLYLEEVEKTCQQSQENLQQGIEVQKVKQLLTQRINRCAQRLLPNCAELRVPQYPGLQCSYRTQHGIFIKLSEELYQDPHFDQETMTAMKYFLVGNRMYDQAKAIVKKVDIRRGDS